MTGRTDALKKEAVCSSETEDTTLCFLVLKSAPVYLYKLEVSNFKM